MRTSYGGSDGVMAYAIGPAKGSEAYAASFVRLLNFYNLSRSQLKSAAPESEAVPVLLDHVVGVVGSGPQEKMVRVDASPDIASVKNVFPVGDFTPMKRPRNAVGAGSLSAPSALTITTGTDSADP